LEAHIPGRKLDQVCSTDCRAKLSSVRSKLVTDELVVSLETTVLATTHLASIEQKRTIRSATSGCSEWKFGGVWPGIVEGITNGSSGVGIALTVVQESGVEVL
jgi:hypothetical protein